MQSSTEINMYSLNTGYKSIIIYLIKRLRKHPFITFKTNGMSTQIFDDYKRGMNVNNT